MAHTQKQPVRKWWKCVIDYPPFNSLIQFTVVSGIATKDQLAEFAIEFAISSGLTSTFEAVYSILCSALLQVLN